MVGSVLALFALCNVHAGDDERELVQMPEMMQEHMLSNMRDHLAALNEILGKLAAGELDGAAAIAEFRLGMSSLEIHGASHMAKVMPEGMRSVGTRMHRAASRFAFIRFGSGSTGNPGLLSCCEHGCLEAKQIIKPGCRLIHILDDHPHSEAS